MNVTENFTLSSFWVSQTQAVHETHRSRTPEHAASRAELCNFTDCSKYMFVLFYNCSSFKLNSTTISTWLFFIHLNIDHITKCFVWEIFTPLFYTDLKQTCLKSLQACYISRCFLAMWLLSLSTTALLSEAKKKKKNHPRSEGALVWSLIPLEIQRLRLIPNTVSHL